MKNYGDLGGCYPPRPRASTDNALLDLHNSSKDTQPDSLIVNYFIGPLGSLKINQQLIQWISSSKLLVVTTDNKLTWTKHISELKRGFVNKLNLIKRSRFLPRNSLLDLYFQAPNILKSFYPRLHMRYQFGGVGQIRTNLILWNPYIIGLLELYITSRATCPLWM